MNIAGRAFTLLFSVMTSPLLRAQQTTAELTTAKPYGNYATEGVQTVHDAWPSDLLVPGGISSIAAATANTAAETVVNLQPNGASVSATVSEQGGGWARTGAMDLGTMVAPGNSIVPEPLPHTLRLTIRGSAHERGKLEIWASGDITMGAEASIWVDVGDDASDDFAHTVVRGGSFDRRQWDLQLDGNGELRVGIRTAARARVALGQLSSYISAVTVRFTPGRFTAISNEGPQCGARLTAYDTRGSGAHVVALELGIAPALVPGVVVLGSQTISSPIPGSSCQLLTDPVALLPIATDSRGEALTPLTVPAALARLDVRMQDVLWMPGGIVASNATVVTLRP